MSAVFAVPQERAVAVLPTELKPRPVPGCRDVTHNSVSVGLCDEDLVPR